MRTYLAAVLAACAIPAMPARAGVIYNNLTPNNLLATATRPGTVNFEIEAADDFVLANPVSLTGATFTGLSVPNPTGGAADVTQVVMEIYRVFPLDSDTGRIIHVPTRANSPSDVALDSRDSSAGGLTFTSSVLSGSFSALNSIQPGGIHPQPNQTTLGNGPVTGDEVQIDVNLASPIFLAPGHYFFVPQVELSNGGTFFWLSASRPISGPGTTPFLGDLQVWTRDARLDPDWLRAGADIVGGTTLNAAFSLDGTVVPEPSAILLMIAGLALIAAGRRRFARRG